MARLALTGARLFDGETFRDDHHLVVEGGRIVALVPGEPSRDMACRRLDGGILAPGFIDVQVNGGGGVLLNDDPSPQAMRRIAAAHRRFGTTTLLPTLITDKPERIRAAIEAAIAVDDASIIGLHLEGPHLDPARKGAHMAELMRPLGEADAALYADAAAKLGRLLITLAPRHASAQDVAALVGAGVVVSLGHAECTAAEADALFDAGARGVTHLFNAMSGLSARAPGLVGAALARGDVWAGIIADGHHVDVRLLRLALSGKAGPARAFLVTDAMSLVTTEAESFTLNGRVVRRDRTGSVPRLTLENGTLAGADVDMAASLRYLVEFVGIATADALRRATADPADFLGIGAERGRLVEGARADLVHLDTDLNPRSVWMAEDFR
jgi:N-acetylglucosamine-6-phosphate deacetylase